MDVELSHLIEQLKDSRIEQRLVAATALGAFDLYHARAIPALIEVLQDPESDVRLAAIASLMSTWRALIGSMGDVLAPGDEIDESFGPLNSALREALRDENKEVRLSAAEGLRDLYSTDTVVFNVFVDAARDEDESLRRRAALALWLGASDRRAQLFQVETEAGVAVLLELLQDTSKSARNYALRAIGSIGPQARAATPILLKLLQDEDEEMRFNSALALARIGAEAQAALPILAHTLTTSDRLKRKAAAYALRAMGSEAKPVLPALIKGLKDHEKRVRSRCAGALGKIGAGVNDEAIHALLEAERDDDSDVRLAVERALAAIGKEHVQAAQKRATQFEARNFFPLFGFKPEEIPALILMLRDPNPNARAMAATALGNLGAREAVPDLIKLLKDDDEDVRRRAAHSLQTMGVSIAPEEA